MESMINFLPFALPFHAFVASGILSQSQHFTSYSSKQGDSPKNERFKFRSIQKAEGAEQECHELQDHH